MSQHETIQVLKSRFEMIHASFDSAIGYLDAEDIHAFRVDIKKLQAFLHLAPNGAKVKLPTRLRQFYRMVGLIRNLQLQQQRIRDTLLHESALPQSYLTLLAIETAAAIRRARKFAVTKLSMPAVERELLCTFPDDLTNDALRGFTRHTANRLKKLGNNRRPINDETLHSLRKCLKDLLYDHSYIEKEITRFFPSVDSAGKDTIAALIDLLGRFQDLRSGLFFLRPLYIDQVPATGERKILEGIRSKWEKDKAIIKAQVLSLLPAVQLSPVHSVRRMTILIAAPDQSHICNAT